MAEPASEVVDEVADEAVDEVSDEVADEVADSVVDTSLDVEEKVESSEVATAEDSDDDGDISKHFLTAGSLPHHEIETFHLDEAAIERTCAPGWSNCDARTFDVRVGPHYVSGQKAASKDALYSVFAVDGFFVPLKVNGIHRYTKLDEYIESYRLSVDDDETGVKAKLLQTILPPITMINFMVPGYEPEVSTGKDNGEGWVIVVCARMSDDLAQDLVRWGEEHYFPSVSNLSGATVNGEGEIIGGDGAVIALPRTSVDYSELSPAIRLLSEFIHAKPGTDLRQRFKCIARVMNLSYTGLGFLVRQMIGQYNAKPFLARTSSTFYYESQRIFAADIDVHLFGYPARKGLAHLRDSVQSVIYDIGFVIEGDKDDELPEQILLCTRISKLGKDAASVFPIKLLEHIYHDHPEMLRAALEASEKAAEAAKKGHDWSKSEPVISAAAHDRGSSGGKSSGGLWGWLG
jgi:hypothetical protein